AVDRWQRRLDRAHPLVRRGRNHRLRGQRKRILRAGDAHAVVAPVAEREARDPHHHAADAGRRPGEHKRITDIERRRGARCIDRAGQQRLAEGAQVALRNPGRQAAACDAGVLHCCVD
ncbi:hypothetical protein RZS08_33965, partial [Arthrospira platensis SPKY1]|nr:hypothetical protein [Arthrospira platensis SPKY1]